jgi:hypothetical protein
MPALRYQGFSS